MFMLKFLSFLENGEASTKPRRQTALDKRKKSKSYRGPNNGLYVQRGERAGMPVTSQDDTVRSKASSMAKYRTKKKLGRGWTGDIMMVWVSWWKRELYQEVLESHHLKPNQVVVQSGRATRQEHHSPLQPPVHSRHHVILLQLQNHPGVHHYFQVLREWTASLMMSQFFRRLAVQYYNKNTGNLQLVLVI